MSAPAPKRRERKRRAPRRVYVVEDSATEDKPEAAEVVEAWLREVDPRPRSS